MENSEFLAKLRTLVYDKEQWYESTEIPRLVKLFREEHQATMQLMENFIKRGFIHDDPYKNDKTVRSLVAIEDSPIPAGALEVSLGVRLSDFERTLDYICNSFLFSVQSLSQDVIKQLFAINSLFLWDELGNSDTNYSTKALWSLIASIKQRGDSVNIAVANDMITGVSKNVAPINQILSAFSEFKREDEKLQIREALEKEPSYIQAAAGANANVEFEKIRELFASKKINLPFSTQNIQQIVLENVAPDAEERRHALFQKLAIPSDKRNAKKKQTPREMLLDAVFMVNGFSNPFSEICKKIEQNVEILKAQDANIFSNFITFLKKLFRIKEPPVEYKVRIVQEGRATSQLESIVIDEFLGELQKRANFYAGFSSRNSKNYLIVNEYDDQKLCEFMKKQLQGCFNSVTLLNALDMFFKENVKQTERSKIRGFKIEITTISNLIFKIRSLFYDAIDELKIKNLDEI